MLPLKKSGYKNKLKTKSKTLGVKKKKDIPVHFQRLPPPSILKQSKHVKGGGKNLFQQVYLTVL